MRRLTKQTTDSQMDSKACSKFNAATVMWRQLLQLLMLSVLLNVVFIRFVSAAEPAATKLEIAHLFTVLEASNCQFYRNGSWYVTKDASAHLQSKYRYLQDKDLVPSAEKFIERAATQSSLSGTAYQIKCADSVAQPSAPWFQAALLKYRAGVKGK
jgi:hypothetical protein